MEYKAERGTYRMFTMIALVPDGLFFANYEGRLIDPGTLTHKLARIVARRNGE